LPGVETYTHPIDTVTRKCTSRGQHSRLDPSATAGGRAAGVAPHRRRQAARLLRGSAGASGLDTGPQATCMKASIATDRTGKGDMPLQGACAARRRGVTTARLSPPAPSPRLWRLGGCWPSPRRGPLWILFRVAEAGVGGAARAGGARDGPRFWPRPRVAAAAATVRRGHRRQCGRRVPTVGRNDRR
jgi:hypothetical protein